MKVCSYFAVGALALLQSGAGHTEDRPPLARYEPGELAAAEFSLDQRTREGGRLTPFFSKYRADVTVDGGKQVNCQFHTKAERGHLPGTTGEIGLICPVPLAEGQVFEAYERRRLIGRGVVLARPD